MTTTVRPAGAVVPRPAPLRYAAPSTARFVLVVVALLAAGLFAGSWMHNLLDGDRWVAEVARCTGSAQGATVIDRQRSVDRCLAPVEVRRAAHAVGGAALTAAGGVLVVALAPAVVPRRRRLRPLPPALSPTAERCATLAREAGLHRPPEVLLGGSRQRDAFTFGVPGRYRIALPRAVALRPQDPRLFTPVLRHELAHVAHHDVALAWLARSMGYAVVPVLVLPLVVSAVQHDTSVMVDYAWRAALVLVVVRLVGAAVLRSREHDADLAAAHDPTSRAALRALLAGLAARGAEGPGRSRRPRTRPWTAWGSAHPAAGLRVAVVDDPALVVRPTTADGLAAAFLAGTVEPLVRSVAVTVLTAPGLVDLAGLLTALTSGALLGTAVGVGLWRAAVYERVMGRHGPVWRVAVGVGLGLALGQMVSLGAVGTLAGGLDVTRAVLAVLAGAGATTVAHGLGVLWADAAPRLPGARSHSTCALLTTTLVLTSGVWTVDRLGNGLGWVGGWGALGTLLAVTPTWLPVVVTLGVAGSAAVPLLLRPQGARTPAWVLEQGPRYDWPLASPPRTRAVLATGALAGLTAALGIGTFRLVSGAATTSAGQEERFLAYTALAAAAGAVCVPALGLVRGAAGCAAGLLAATVAVPTTAAGFVAINVSLAGGAAGGLFLLVTGTALPVALMGGLLLGVAGLLRPGGSVDPVAEAAARATAAGLPPPPPSPRGRPDAGLVVAGVALAVGLTAAAALVLLPAGGSLARAPRELEADATALTAEAQEEAYLQGVAGPLLEQFATVATTVTAINADPTTDAAVRAGRVRAEVLPLLSDMAGKAQAYRPPTDRLAEVHATAVQAVAELSDGMAAYADAVALHDPEALGAAQDRIAHGAQLQDSWTQAVLALAAGGRTG